jgi:histidyl-tRNA synthetase
MPAGARVQFDPTLVRGMGYYTGTIFEMASAAFPSSIAGGGRYDRMVGRMLGRDVPACGFSIGFERLIMILGERVGLRPPAAGAGPATGRIALLVEAGGDLAGALAAARGLRAEGHQVSLELKRRNLGKQLEDFAAHGFTAHGTWEPGRGVVLKPLTGGRERR